MLQDPKDPGSIDPSTPKFRLNQLFLKVKLLNPIDPEIIDPSTSSSG